MLNVLVLKDRVSRSDLSNYFDWTKIGVSKLVTTDDIAKIPFKNLDDIDFIIVTSETLTKSAPGLLEQITEKGLNSKLVLLGEIKDSEKLTYIICNGLRYYEPDEERIEGSLKVLVEKMNYKKETEKMLQLQLHDGTLVKKIKQALDKGDSRLLQKIISNGLKILPASVFLVKEYYMLVMKTVFEFAEEKGVRHIDKKEMIIELGELNDFESVKDYTLKRMNSLVHLVEVNKNNQNKMVAEYIKDYIDENYMKQDTNAGNIAERFGVSGSYIGMLFREQQKTTITKYITQLRINKAAELLAETKQQIQVIAKKVGYSDQNYFARIFKKQTGLSPGEYRSNSLH